MTSSSTLITLSPIFCINLDIYPERWNRTKTEIKRTFSDSPNPPKLHRYPAIDRTNDNDPGRGCGETFCQLVKRAKSNKWPYVVICEDDVHFVPGAYDKLQKALACVPADADLLSAGSYCLRFSNPSIYNDHWLKINGSYASHHFIIIFESVYDKVLGFKDHPNYRHLDRFIGNRLAAHGKMNVYVIWPMIARQYDGYSTTMRKTVQYNTTIWARKHNLLWYSKEHHHTISATEVSPVPYSVEIIEQYEETLRLYFDFVYHKQEKLTQSMICTNHINEYSQADISRMALFWYVTPHIFDIINKEKYGISITEFSSFRSNIMDFYSLVSHTHMHSPVINDTIDVFHLILAYQQPNVFSSVLKKKYNISLEEFAQIKMEQNKKKCRY